MSKALLNQKLMTELFGDVPVEGKNEEGREENSAQFSSYRQACLLSEHIFRPNRNRFMVSPCVK